MLETFDIALARQPIFDGRDQLVGYELLYRKDASINRAIPPVGGSAHQMSSDTIAGTFLGFGVDRVTGGKRAFVNVDRAMLLDGSVSVLNPHDVVVEVLESVRCDDECVDACAALVEQGYILALDDFVYHPTYERLLRLAKVVKVDVLGQSPAELRRTVAALEPFGVTCLAERVETVAVRDQCAALGFELFQGYFFARPEMLSGKEISVEHASLFRLLNLLRNPAESDRTLEDVFRADLSLTYKLLRIVNTAGSGHSGVTSIGHAIRLLGRAALHRWMALLLVSSLSRTTGTRSELVIMAMVRARFCELLMESTGRRTDGGASFVAGLFSLLDALMRVSMQDLVTRLHLTPELELVLLRREGPYGPILQ